MPYLRNFVLRSNSWPVFKWIYKGIYGGGESLLSILGRLDSSIIGMFLRTSTEPNVPGLSDYDLTVTPRDDAASSERLSFLTQFWKKYTVVKRILPMLCETDILPPQDLIDYMILGPGPTVARKRLSILFERFPPKWKNRFYEAFAHQSCQVSQADFLKEAILRHLRFIVPRSLEYILNPNLINRVKLDHLLSKVFSVIRSNTRPSEKILSNLYKEFRELSLASQRQKKSEKGKAEVVTLSNSDSEVLNLLGPTIQPLLQSPSYPAPTIVLWTGFGTQDKMCLAAVVNDDLQEEPFMTLIRDLAEVWQAGHNIWLKFFNNAPFQAYFPIPSYPIFVSRSIWRSWMYLLPLEAAAVAATGKLVAGDGTILTEVSPYIETIPRDISTRYAAMLSLRNNWRKLTPENLPRFYSLARKQVKSWRLILEGKPICTKPGFDYLHKLDMHKGYEKLQQELTRLRNLLISRHYKGGSLLAV